MGNEKLHRIHIEGLSDTDNELAEKFFQIRQARINLVNKLDRADKATLEGGELLAEGEEGDTFSDANIIMQMARRDLVDMNIGDDQLKAAEEQILAQMSEEGRRELQTTLNCGKMLAAAKALKEQ